MMRTIRAFALLLAFAAAPLAWATHLEGGNLGYVYLGETFPGSGIYSYQVYMQFYLNCDANSNFPDFETLLNQNPNHTLPVGVYIEDPLNPNANKQQQAVVQLALIDSMQIVPALPNNCTIGEGLCTVAGTFSAIVNLPLNFGGYHLYFQMCCRNLSILNLNNPNGTGIGYYAFIPPPLVANSSPIWLGEPTPFLCINDTSTFVNSATDPDGDQLIFSFQTPYDRVDAFGGITPPPTVLPTPIPEVTYNPGFSVAQPFGAGGYSYINGATGLTRYKPTVQGDYIIAVEVKEYRNGLLIGITRRDLQLQAIVCPPNDVPQISGTLPTSYSVNAGDSLCFNMNFIDINADTVTLTSAGTIFDGLLYQPPATIISPVTGAGAVGSQFCWHTACDQGQSQPYLFSVSVTDNGCPPKTLDVVFQIQVNPFTGPQTIIGPQQVCANALGSSYTTPAIAGAVFNWTVAGGAIASGQGTNTITVNWAGQGSGTVSVSATNALGCSSVPVSLAVSIVPLPTVQAGSDVTICSGSSTVIGGTPTGPPGSSYTWVPSSTLNSNSIANPIATPTTSTSYIVLVGNSGCSNRDTVRVTVSSPQVNGGPDATICFGDTAQLNASGIGTFSWSPSSGLSATNIPDPLAFPIITTDYIVTMTDSVTCVDVDTVHVTVNQLPIVNAGADTSLCPGDTVAIGGSPTGPVGSTFVWSPSNGLSSTSIANPLATPQSNATYTVTVTDVNTCVNSDQINLTILPIPVVDAGPDQTVCSGDSVQLNGTGAGSLHWSPSFGLSDPNIGNPFATPESTITYTLTVTGGNTCVNSDQVMVTVNVLPNANAGPDQAVCIGDTVQIGVAGPGTFVWSPATGLSATNIATPLAFPTVSTDYTVTLTDSLTCAQSDVVHVTVNALPTVDAGADTTMCPGQSAVIGGSPTGPSGSTYAWTPGNGLNNTSSANPSASPQDTTTYTVTVTDIHTCVNSDQVTVSILPAPSVDAGQDAAFCVGDSTQLSGSGSGSLVWTPATGLSDTLITNPIAHPTSTTTYTLTVTGANTCTSTDQVVVSVDSLPNANAGNDVAICISDSAQLNATGGTGYAWAPITGLSDPNIANPMAAPASTTIYTVTVTNANNCVASDAVTVTVNNAANAGGDGSNLVCSNNPSFDLFALLGGSPQAGGAWIGPGGANNGTFVPGTDMAGIYTYVVVGAAPCTNDSSNVLVSVTTAPNAGGDSTLDLCETAGDVQLGGLIAGAHDANGTWTDPVHAVNNGVFITGTSLLGTYTYTVAGGAPCASDSSVVTINAIIIAPDPGTSNTVSICGSGSVIQLIDSLGGSPDTTGTWTGPDSLPHVGTFDPAIDQQGAYTYHVAGTAPCADAQATVTITITNPNANAGADVAICFGDTTQLSATGGTQYVWTPITSLSDPNIGNPLAYPTSTGTYTVTVTDANGCSGNDAVQVTVHALPIVNAGNDVSICTGQTTPIGGTPTGPAGSTFLWSPAAGLNNTASANPIAQPGSTTNYVVSVTDLNLCNNTDSVLVTVNPLPTINAGNDTTVCTGSGVQLNATGTGTFSWIPSTGLNNASIPNPIASPTATTTYTVTLTDGVSCVNSDDITVTVLGLPSANAGPDLYVCPGFDVQLQGNGGGSFNWSPANTLDNATIANPQASPLSTTVYTLTVTDGNGCSASDIAQVNVSADPPIDAGPDQDICNGQTAVLGGTPTSVPGTTYLWSPSSGLDNATIANPTTSSTTTITYDLAVTSDTCTSHDQVTITLQGVAQGAFVIKLEPTCDEVRAYFTDQSSGGAQWLWDFGDGTTSTEPDPQHYFPYGQPIDVSLVLTDVFGCTDTVTQHIDVATFDNYVHYEMPNVFTPNGDGNNDVFTLNSNAVLGSCATMFIFNRWGQKMFESLAGDLVWDGHNFAGKECTAGTYFFVITVKDITFKGDVYLNR